MRKQVVPSITPDWTARDQHENPRKMERHFPIKSSQSRGMARTIFYSFSEIPKLVKRSGAMNRFVKNKWITPSEVILNVPVGRNRNGPFHLTSDWNFRKLWHNGDHLRNANTFRRVPRVAQADFFPPQYKIWVIVTSRWLDIGQIFFLRVYGTRRRRGISTRKKRNEANIQASCLDKLLVGPCWSIKDLFPVYGFRGNFSCGTRRVIPRGQDSSILPANHSAWFDSSCSGFLFVSDGVWHKVHFFSAKMLALPRPGSVTTSIFSAKKPLPCIKMVLSSMYFLINSKLAIINLSTCSVLFYVMRLYYFISRSNSAVNSGWTCDSRSRHFQAAPNQRSAGIPNSEGTCPSQPIGWKRKPAVVCVS